MNTPPSNRPPLDFKEIKVVSDPVSRLAIRISKATGDDGKARYRCGIGSLGRAGTDTENKFFRDISVFVGIHDRRVTTVRGIDGRPLVELLRSAEEFVRMDVQEKFDEEDMNHSSKAPTGLPGLKTWAKRDAEKRKAGG